MIERIKFQGREFILVDGGAIATEDDYKAGKCSYAHLCRDGLVRRFHEVIGDEEDVERLGEVKVDLGNPVEAIVNILTDSSWEGGDR